MFLYRIKADCEVSLFFLFLFLTVCSYITHYKYELGKKEVVAMALISI